MFKKFRRNSKQPQQLPLRQASRYDSIATANECSNSESTAPKLTFFDLPPEIRNTVYKYVASNTALTLRPPTLRKTQPGLFLASRQTRNEYLAILLSVAPIRVPVQSFDFRNVQRVLGSLYRTELKALRENRQLTILLIVDHCTTANLASLRRWLVHRSGDMDRLPWRYEVSRNHPYRMSDGNSRLYMNALGWQMLVHLYDSVNDSMQWELRNIMSAFELEARRVDAAAVCCGEDGESPPPPAPT